MAHRGHTRSQSVSSSQPPPPQKLKHDPVTDKTAHSTVSCVYQTHIGGFWRNVTVLWSKNLGIFGRKRVTRLSRLMETNWTPIGIFDLQNFPAAQNPALVDAALFSKKEHVFAKKCFSTRAKFDDRQKEHEIIVESSTSGNKDPEMWISIDGIVLIHIRNLQWKFRGNQTVLVDKQPIQVFWDVHSWLFCAPGSTHGMFIFKPGTAEADSDKEENSQCDDSDSSNNSWYYSTKSYVKASQFCLFLYAWKIE